MKKKILVAYLCTKYEDNKAFVKFINSYKKYKAGHAHNLLICYKLLDNKKLKFCRNVAKTTKHSEFVDGETKNDYDFGSLSRVVKKYKKMPIFYFNGHSYPVKNNWLKKTSKYLKKNTLIGTTGSYESLYTSLKIKKYYKIFKNIYNLFFFKVFFNAFPNPHLRTANFLFNSIDFLNFNKDKIYNNKIDAWKSESGKNSLTNFFLKKGYKILIVNSDGKSFTIPEWKQSNTYCHKNQEKLLISDKHTHKYSISNKLQKRKLEKKAWGF